MRLIQLSNSVNLNLQKEVTIVIDFNQLIFKLKMKIKGHIFYINIYYISQIKRLRYIEIPKKINIRIISILLFSFIFLNKIIIIYINTLI